MRWTIWIAAIVALLLAIGAEAHAAPPSQVPPDAEYFGLIVVVLDEEGVHVPIRNGDSTLGHAKACAKHNLCKTTVISRTIAGGGNKEVLGTHRVRYTSHIVGEGHDITVRVLVHTGRDTARGETPDGCPVGVITAYCEGMVRCPDVVNSV